MSSHIAVSVRVVQHSIEDGHLDEIESNLEAWFLAFNRPEG